MKDSVDSELTSTTCHDSTGPGGLTADMAASVALSLLRAARKNWSITFQLEKPAGYSLISEKVFQKTLHGGNFFLALDGRD